MASSAALSTACKHNSERPSKQFTVWSCASIEENTSKRALRESTPFILSPNTLWGVGRGCVCNTLHSQTPDLSLSHTVLRITHTGVDPFKLTQVNPEWIKIIYLRIIWILKDVEATYMN